MNNWVKNFVRPEGAGNRSSGLKYSPRNDARTEQDMANNRARRIREDIEITNSIPASDYEYYERMARELEAEHLEGAA